MNKTTQCIAVWFSMLLSFVWASSQQAHAQKPILAGWHADPSFHQWDGKYWIYPSTDEAQSTSWKEMCRWNCFSSTDLKHWKDEGEIFSLKDISWASIAAFAPDAMKWKGKYYFFFPAEFQIGVAVSDKPTGPFKDALGKPLIKKRECKGVNSFDPCIFIDDDKTPYLYYGGGGGCAMTELADDLVTRVGDLKKIPLPHYGEGIWVHKHKDLYYFTYPMHYKVEGKVKQLLVYCTAPSPKGPFTYRGAFFDNDSRNSHHSIVTIGDKHYLFYHVEGPSPYERLVCADYLHYNEDGTIQEVVMTRDGIDAVPIQASTAK